MRGKGGLGVRLDVLTAPEGREGKKREGKGGSQKRRRERER